jgi:hypothetical protein
MGNIERWWRVHAPLTGKTTWTDEDPNDRLHAAWENAQVRGPFVLEADTQGAVDALREVVDEAKRQTPALSGDRLALTIGYVVLNRLGGQ